MTLKSIMKKLEIKTEQELRHRYGIAEKYQLTKKYNGYALGYAELCIFTGLTGRKLTAVYTDGQYGYGFLENGQFIHGNFSGNSYTDRYGISRVSFS